MTRFILLFRAVAGLVSFVLCIPLVLICEPLSMHFLLKSEDLLREVNEWQRQQKSARQETERK